MNIQPIDLPSLLRAVTWPVITIIALAIFWRPLTDLVKILAPRINKLSVGGLSLELAQVSEMKAPTALDTEIRQLDAGLVPQSGVTGLTGLLSQLQHGGQRDYIVIDLGSEASRRWLTSRLYLLALLITLIDLCAWWLSRPLGMSANDSWEQLLRTECVGLWRAPIAGWKRRVLRLTRAWATFSSIQQPGCSLTCN